MQAAGQPHDEIRLIGEKSADGVFVYLVKEQYFSYTNEVFNRMFQYNPNGTPSIDFVLKLVLSEDKDYLLSRFKELVNTGALNSAEFRLKHSDKQLAHFCCDVFMTGENTITGFVKDITKAKEHENYLVEYTAKKDAFLDMITHNLSGPLYLSKNILGWLQKSMTKNDVAHLETLLNLLSENTEQCIDIVNDFLHEEHIESQQVYVRKTRFNAVEKIKPILEKLRDMNPDKKFFFESVRQDVNILSDSVKFFQIIHNLLSNAIKFTPADGKITISVTEEDKSYIFTISDNGIGVPEKLIPFLFNKRGAAGREGLQGEKSNGIGLFVVKKLVELLDGEIWFESSENSGSSFFVKLPKD